MHRIDTMGRWIVIAFLAVAVGCTLSGKDTLFPEKDVSSDFPIKLKDVVTARCTGAGCHSASKAGGLSLEPGQEIANLVDQPSLSNPGYRRVEPGDVENSVLIWRLRALQGQSVMPPSYDQPPGPLNEAEIALFEDWIAGLPPSNPPTEDGIEPPDAGTDTVGDTGPIVETVDQVFVEHCAPCHAGNSPFQEPKLNPEVYLGNLLNVAPSKKPEILYVVPGDLDNSYLIWRMEGTNDTGIMPPSGAIPDEHLAIVKDWILGLASTPCEPQCTGKSCGDDGCGGTCGGCPDGEGCDSEGQCIPTVPADVASVFDSHCTVCHKGSNPPEGLNLLADVAYSNLVGMPSAKDPSELLVTPGDSENSMLMWRLEKSNGQNLMPPGNKKIPDADIETIKSWIDSLPSGDAP